MSAEDDKKKRRAEQSRKSRLKKKMRIVASMSEDRNIVAPIHTHKNGLYISITIRGIIERGLWTNYEQFVLHNHTQEQKEELIANNVVVELSEEDAYLTGLLKVIYTDNVCHVLNLYINSLIINKSFQEKSGKTLIAREVLLVGIDKFHKKFPPTYVPDAVWRMEIDKAAAYAEEVKEGIMSLRKHDGTMLVQDQVCVAVASVKKLLRNNH